MLTEEKILFLKGEIKKLKQKEEELDQKRIFVKNRINEFEVAIREQCPHPRKDIIYPETDYYTGEERQTTLCLLCGDHVLSVFYHGAVPLYETVDGKVKRVGYTIDGRNVYRRETPFRRY